MRVTLKNIATNFDRIETSSFWSEDKERELKMHRIHAYPAKFPSFVVTRSLEYAKNKKIPVETIADIFCGCGTTALEAKLNNLNFWGCDLNPVATLIAQTKSGNYSLSKIEENYEIILSNFKKLKQTNKLKFNPGERIRYWFKDKQVKDLYFLITAIDKSCADRKYKDFFLCAFSNILKGCSKWLTKSIKPQVDPEKIPNDVRSSFEKQVAFMKVAIEEVANPKERKKTKIVTANFLNLRFKEPFADMLVTSPPYATSYEYADLHQLSALWLGFVSDYRVLREGSIGSLYRQNLTKEEIEKSLNPIGLVAFKKLSKNDFRKATSVARYFIDLDKTVKNASTVLKKNGTTIFVIGNTKYKNVPIDNAKYLVHSLLVNGFDDVNIYKRKVSSKILTPYRNKKGKFSSDLRHRKVYGHEFVVTAIKK